MNRLESTKLFQDILLVSDKYKNLKLKDNDKEVEDNRKLHSLLGHYKGEIEDIKRKSHFLSSQTREDLKNKDKQEMYKIAIDLNDFSSQKYSSLLNEDIESTTVKAVMFSTIEELDLVNNSIRSKDFLLDKNTYFYIYEKVTINAFMTFLALKDMNLNEKLIHNLSQSIFAQIKVLSIISML